MAPLRRRVTILAALAAVFAVAAPAGAATHAGDLDPSFNGTGRNVFQPRGTVGAVTAAAIQPDGKLLLGGYDGDLMAVSRLNQDGTLDGSFGVNGTATVTFDPNPGDSVPYYMSTFAIALQGDRIVIVGTEQRGGTGGARIAVARLNSNGSLDTSFAAGENPGGGLLAYHYGFNADNQGFDVAVLPDRRILVAGYGGAQSQFTVVRLSVDGAIDRSFGENGTGYAQFDPAHPAHAFTMSVAPDGGIVLAGTSGAAPSTSQFAVARFTPEGKPDAQFGTNGKLVVATGTPPESVRDSGITGNGDIVLFGKSGTNIAVSRLAPNGSQRSIGGQAVLKVPVSDVADSAAAMAIQPDGKLVLAGTRNISDPSKTRAPLVLRLNEDGTRDSGFGTNGVANFDFGPGRGAADTVALYGDGRIAVGGSLAPGQLNQPAAARLFGASTADDPGPGAPGPGPGGPDSGDGSPTTVLSGLKLKPTAFPAASSGASITASASKPKKRKTGTTITYTDAQNATATFTVLRSSKGRSVGGKCVKPTRSNRTAKSCTLLKKVGSFSNLDVAGPNKAHFTGRVKKRKLAPGSYRLQVTATGANGVPSAPLAKSFRIIP